MKTYPTRKRVWFTAGSILLIAILFVVFIDLEVVLHLLRGTDWRWLAAASLALISGYVLLAVRWRYLLVQRPSFSRVFHSMNTSQMVNIYTPIPAVPLRILLIGDGEQVTISQAVSGSLIERILEQIMRLTALGGALLLGAAIAGSRDVLIGGLGLIMIALGLVTWVVRQPQAAGAQFISWIARLPFIQKTKVEQLVIGLVQGLSQAGMPKQLFTGWLWSLLMWACFLFFHLFGLMALGLGLPIQVMLRICLSALAAAPPSAPAMPGTYHASIVASMAVLTNIDGVTLTAYAIILHIIQIVCLTGLGMWALIHLNISLREVLRASAKTQIRNQNQIQDNQQSNR